MKSYKNVDEYIDKSSAKAKDKLIEIRLIVKSISKEIDEGIAYGMPSYKLMGEPLFYFASMKGHIGIYPTPNPIKVHKNILKDFSTSKGCVRIPYEKKIPISIIKKLIKERVKEIKANKSKTKKI